MITCFIIDDEPDAIHVLKKFIAKSAELKLIGESTNSTEGLRRIKENPPHLVFLDIQMDQMDGILLAKSLPKSTHVVFCTAFPEFAVKSYDLEAVDYLMKPVKLPRFNRAVQRVADCLAARPTVTEEAIPDDYIYVKAGQRDKLLRVDLDDIEFIESHDHYIAFYLSDRKILAYLTMKKILERLPNMQFMRVHKSYIVALKQISAVTNGQLSMKRRTETIPIGAIYREIFMERMKQNLM